MLIVLWKKTQIDLCHIRCDLDLPQKFEGLFKTLLVYREFIY